MLLSGHKEFQKAGNRGVQQRWLSNTLLAASDNTISRLSKSTLARRMHSNGVRWWCMERSARNFELERCSGREFGRCLATRASKSSQRVALISLLTHNH